MNNKIKVEKKVLDFYSVLPFNYPSSPEIAANEIKNHNTLYHYFRDKENLFNEKTSVLELGCGIGWMSNMINFYHKSRVTGIDFNPKVIHYAKEISKSLGTNANFEVCDIFKYDKGQYDIVVSIGVLHSTYDCLKGIEKACNLTKTGGYTIIGLYNTYGRRPFLDYFEKLKKRNYTEEQLFEEYLKLDNRHKDKTFARSWFNDQVIHPHETLHTLQEVVDVYNKCNVELDSASFNEYKNFSNIEELKKLEVKQYEKGMMMLDERKFYSGFFIVIGKKIGENH